MIEIDSKTSLPRGDLNQAEKNDCVEYSVNRPDDRSGLNFYSEWAMQSFAAVLPNRVRVATCRRW